LKDWASNRYSANSDLLKLALRLFAYPFLLCHLCSCLSDREQPRQRPEREAAPMKRSTISRIFVPPMAMLAGSLGLALAQSGPVDLHPAKPPAPKSSAPLPPSMPSSSTWAATGGGDSAAPIGAGEAVRRANA
jgi:hypothetical protein